MPKQAGKQVKGALVAMLSVALAALGLNATSVSRIENSFLFGFIASADAANRPSAQTTWLGAGVASSPRSSRTPDMRPQHVLRQTEKRGIALCRQIQLKSCLA